MPPNNDDAIARGWKVGFGKFCEGMAAAMLVAMFSAFILQIVSRYALNSPFGWTLELCLTLWVWLVFWGGAFVVKHRDHVTFDVFYNSARPRLRRWLALTSAAAIVVAFVGALYPTWDFIDFLKIKKSAVLRVPMRTVFSIYAVFMVVVIIAYGCRFILIARRGGEGAGSP